jgi:glycogen operon protein
MERFTQRLIALRQKHPILRADRFLHGQDSAEGLKDITWYAPNGGEMTSEYWNDNMARCAGLMLNEKALPGSDAARATVLLLLTNAHTDVVDFTLPALAFGTGWRKLIDTAAPGEEETAADDVMAVPGRSLTLLQRV